MNSATRCWNKMQPNFELKLQKGATADFTYKVTFSKIARQVAKYLPYFW